MFYKIRIDTQKGYLGIKYYLQLSLDYVMYNEQLNKQ